MLHLQLLWTSALSEMCERPLREFAVGPPGHRQVVAPTCATDFGPCDQVGDGRACRYVGVDVGGTPHVFYAFLAPTESDMTSTDVERAWRECHAYRVDLGRRGKRRPILAYPRVVHTLAGIWIDDRTFALIELQQNPGMAVCREHHFTVGNHGLTEAHVQRIVEELEPGGDPAAGV